MRRFLWLIRAFTADSSPKQAAGAGMGAAFAVIPYCFARAMSEMFGDEGTTATTERYTDRRPTDKVLLTMLLIFVAIVFAIFTLHSLSQ